MNRTTSNAKTAKITHQRSPAPTSFDHAHPPTACFAVPCDRRLGAIASPAGRRHRRAQAEEGQGAGGQPRREGQAAAGADRGRTHALGPARRAGQRRPRRSTTGSHAAQVAAQAQARAEEVLEAAAATTAAARSVLNGLAANAYRSQSSGGTLGGDARAGQHRRPGHADGGDEPPRPGRQDPESGARRAQARRGRAEAAPRRPPRRRAPRPRRPRAPRARRSSRPTHWSRSRPKPWRRCDRCSPTTKQAAHAAHQRASSSSAPSPPPGRGPRDPARAGPRRRAHAAAAATARASRAIPTVSCPVRALCGLWGRPGEMLQASAAAAFNRMSQAFNAVFGEPLCVEASYRTYQRQVELYASMPAGYAAVPGTSNHGWGLATDLCGGIQVDNSPEHCGCSTTPRSSTGSTRPGRCPAAADRTSRGTGSTPASC